MNTEPLSKCHSDLTHYAWYRDNSDNQTHPVGQTLANLWGLYDMHGHVWEWCQDWWAYDLPGGIALDPQGPTEGSYRVIRGGGLDRWSGWDIPVGCGSAHRYGSYPESGSNFFGFRVVLAPGQP